MQGFNSRRSLSANATGPVLWLPRRASKDMPVWVPCTRDMLPHNHTVGTSTVTSGHCCSTSTYLKGVPPLNCKQSARP